MSSKSAVRISNLHLKPFERECLYVNNMFRIEDAILLCIYPVVIHLRKPIKISSKHHADVYPPISGSYSTPTATRALIRHMRFYRRMKHRTVS